uniref:Histone H1 n=2 Tax=Kalmanozyma brasiliensis (strain GHG001) TaxID=1365824 RepID=V5F1Q3_KALBG
MIVEGLRVMGQAPPRTLFNWMQDTYPLMKKFRPSAHQALQKAFKRGRLLKTGSLYRINPSWSDPGESRKPTRRPQVGRDHPMVTPGLNGEVLAVSPLKDSQAYRNVGDSGLRAMSKGARQGPRPYGQPGAAPLANPASTIFPSGSATEILLEYQKRIGKKIEPDSVRYLYQLIRSGPSDGSMEEMLAHMLTQTGYHDAAAEATAAAAAQTAAAAAAASMPSYPRPGTGIPATMATGMSSPSSMFARTGATPQRRMPASSAATGPTSLPLPSTSEPTMMQQLASMLNDLSSPINPVLANSLLGQLSSNAAAAAAARAASMPGMGAAPPLPAAPSRAVPPASSAASSQLASALSSLTGQAPQQDLDSAVSETLAAALQQIGGPQTAAPVPSEAAEKVPAPKAVDAAEGKEGEEGIDLAEYEDAIRALTSAFGDGGEDAGSDESDAEADERAIAAAEAEPDSVDEPGQAVQAPQKDAAEQEQAEAGEAEEDEDEEDEAEGGEQMDLTAVLQQLTASLQAHGEIAPDTQGEGDVESAAAKTDQADEQPSLDKEGANKQTSDSMDVDAPTNETANVDGETAEVEGASEDPASLQAQLEALVASLAANAEEADEEDDDDDDDEEEE